MHEHETYLRDYSPPQWEIPLVELEFDLDLDATLVYARFHVAAGADPSAPLRLDGEALELIELRRDGVTLGADEYTLDDSVLEIPVAAGALIETRVRIDPMHNDALQGLYVSGSRAHGFLLTQCEAEGFRRITFFPDRPDVLSRYRVSLRADAARFPVLLAGGNLEAAGELPDGRHFARFYDPWPRPSYLFALVAGALESMQREHTTPDGRTIRVVLWSEPDALARLEHAMAAVLAAMRWDEETYGRVYDLDVFHVVATGDFNMGAMENKGLNIFNSKYLLADFESSTDDDHAFVEAVVGHEYFHNWSGNRVTCRDWFQLALKEGFTVFREQQFAAHMGSPTLQRIHDVTRLKTVQFAEDRSALAHPVRPSSYCAIDNFYTATVYEKGAELVRMLATRLGAAGFRRGTDLYFSRCDGKAVTIEDFLSALGDANGLDLMPYLAWYEQAGTPVLEVRCAHDAANACFTIEVRQTTAVRTGDAPAKPLPVPLAVALFNADGTPLPLRRQGEAAAAGVERVIELTGATEQIIFEDIPARPTPSLLRGFSAPVELRDNASNTDLALLVTCELGGFDRWLAGQRLATRAFLEHYEGTHRGATAAWCDALGAAWLGAASDDADAVLAELLDPPSERALQQELASFDPEATRAARETLLAQLAQALGTDRIAKRHDALRAAESGTLDRDARARRRLANRLLALWSFADREQALDRAFQMQREARGMTDRLAALSLLIHLQDPRKDQAIAAFRARHGADPLALDKLFAARATTPGDAALRIVHDLAAGADYVPRNPNRVYAILGSFANANPTGFHRADGAGYRFLAERLTELDRINPLVAARLATAYATGATLPGTRGNLLREVVADLLGMDSLSRGLRENLARIASVHPP